MTRVLIADDVAENRYLLTALLQGHGYEVVSAANGAEALSLGQSSLPDLIITDVLMPIMDGFELCRRWRRDERLKGIPFVIYTATYTDPKDERLALSLGADRFLIKPQAPELLIQTVQEVLERTRRDPDAVCSEPPGDELELVRMHNEALARKLEKKVFQLEAEIAQRAEMESVLRESEKKYRQLVETLQEGIWVVDENSCTAFANRRMADILGCTVEDMHGRHLFSFLDEEGAKTAGPLLEQPATDIRGQHELEFVRNDGGRVRALWEAAPITDEAGNYAGAIAGVVDITDRRRLEEQLRASQRMEAIGSLAGGVAHDFNNLLSVIMSYTEFAQERAPAGDPIQSDLSEVKKAAEHAVALTRQLLAFGRRQMLQAVPLDVNQIAAGVEKMLRRILGEDIEYVQQLAGDLGVVRADAGQIEQVLMNLVVNARDAMPEGGRLTVETANVEFGEWDAKRHAAVKPGSYVTLAVSDTGCGMDEQTRAQIFEPFFTTKEKGKGTGLGLSTVYGIVRQSGGDIWVDSEPGRGTTFRIYLPRELSATTAVATRPARVPAQVTGTETILVVEDEEALRRVAARTLEEAGYTVLTAANGKAALRASDQHAGEIDLLVTDVVMPQMSGSTLAREIVKTRPSLKVAYVSGYADDAISHQGVLDAGMPFLAKPFTSTDLRRKVREVLDVGVADVAGEQRNQNRGPTE